MSTLRVPLRGSASLPTSTISTGSTQVSRGFSRRPSSAGPFMLTITSQTPRWRNPSVRLISSAAKARQSISACQNAQQPLWRKPMRVRRHHEKRKPGPLDAKGISQLPRSTPSRPSTQPSRRSTRPTGSSTRPRGWAWPLSPSAPLATAGSWTTSNTARLTSSQRTTSAGRVSGNRREEREIFCSVAAFPCGN